MLGLLPVSYYFNEEERFNTFNDAAAAGAGRQK